MTPGDAPVNVIGSMTVSTSSSEVTGHVRSLVRRSGTSFFWAMRTLPAAKRNAMYAVYAFCREVDDIADDPGEEADKRTRLDQWRDEVERIYAGRPRFAISHAVAGAVARFGLRKQDFLSVIDGMEMDAAPRVRIADMDELNLYCDRVACAVGRLSVRVFGVDGAHGDRVAHALGRALQLTNILRDLHEDAQRDRLYLPGELLRAHGVTGSDAAAILTHPALPDVCAEVAEMAERRFDEAVSALAACDRHKVRPAIVMMEVYRKVFRLLVRRGWRRLGEPVKLSRAEKLWIAFRHGMV